MSSESENEGGRSTPPELRQIAENISGSLLPEKSKHLYLKAYSNFKDWCLTKSVTCPSENVLLVYFQEKAENQKAATLWATYSMLKSTFKVRENIDISKYYKLIAFLKRKNVSYKPKKSSVLNKEQITKFLTEAQDEIFLPTKVSIYIPYISYWCSLFSKFIFLYFVL